MSKQKIPAAPSIKRLPSYLHLIRQAKNEGFEFISGTLIANELHLEPIQVRKDLAITGIAASLEEPSFFRMYETLFQPWNAINGYQKVLMYLYTELILL